MRVGHHERDTLRKSCQSPRRASTGVPSAFCPPQGAPAHGKIVTDGTVPWHLGAGVRRGSGGSGTRSAVAAALAASARASARCVRQLCEQFDALLPKLVRRALAHKFDGLFGSAKTRDREAFRPVVRKTPSGGQVVDLSALIRTISELDDHPRAPPAATPPLPLRRPPPARPREPGLAWSHRDTGADEVSNRDRGQERASLPTFRSPGRLIGLGIRLPVREISGNWATTAAPTSP